MSLLNNDKALDVSDGGIIDTIKNNLFDRKFKKSIDSLSLKIPFSRIKIIDSRLTESKVLVYEDSAEM